MATSGSIGFFMATPYVSDLMTCDAFLAMDRYFHVFNRRAIPRGNGCVMLPQISLHGGLLECAAPRDIAGLNQLPECGQPPAVRAAVSLLHQHHVVARKINARLFNGGGRKQHRRVRLMVSVLHLFCMYFYYRYMYI